MIAAGNFTDKFEKIDTFWDPHIVSELNGQQVKVAKFLGDFPAHLHEKEDEMFIIFKGTITIEFQGDQKVYKEGDFVMIPRGTVHQPSAEKEAWVILFEPASTLNTGDTENQMTKKELKRI